MLNLFKLTLETQEFDLLQACLAGLTDFDELPVVTNQREHYIHCSRTKTILVSFIDFRR